MTSISVKVKDKVSVSASITKPTAATIQTDFEADKLTPEVGEQVQFTDKSSLSPSKWGWFFGDGNSSEGKNPTHSYLKKGKKTVRLHSGSTGTAADDAGNVEEKSDYIDVQAPTFSTDAFLGTTGDVLNDSLNEADPDNNDKIREVKDDSPNARDQEQTTASKQPAAGEYQGNIVHVPDKNDDFMALKNFSGADLNALFGTGRFAVTLFCWVFSTDNSALVGVLDDDYLSLFYKGKSQGRIELRTDISGNTKRFETQIGIDGPTVFTAIFNETGSHEAIINGTNETLSQIVDQGPDFSQANFGFSPYYLARNNKGTDDSHSFADYASPELWVHDDADISNGLHTDAHDHLRKLYNI